MRKLLKLFPILALVATVLVASPAKATVSYPDNDAQWSNCADASSTYCVDTFQVDTDMNSTDNWGPAPDGVVAVPAFYGATNDSPQPSLVIYVWGPHGSELNPDLPTGSKVHLVVNLGAWDPNTDFSLASAWVLKWKTYKVGANWMLAVDFKTEPMSWATNCTYSSDPWTLGGQTYDYCQHPTDRTDYASYAQFTLFSNDLLTPGVDTAIEQSQAGTWISNNATSAGSPTLDPTAKTLQLDYAGPPTLIDGTPNYIFAQAFFPDHVLRDVYGIDPASVENISHFTVTNNSVTVPATFTRVTGTNPGMLLNIGDTHISTLSIGTPSHLMPLTVGASAASHLKVQIKNTRKSAPGKSTITSHRVTSRKFVILGFNAGSFTDNVQSHCTKGSHSVSGSTMMGLGVSSVHLSKGTWSCKIRSMRANGTSHGHTVYLYSAWSPAVAIRVN